MNIVVAGPKGSGKTTVAGKVAERLGLRFFDIDRIIEDMYSREKGVTFSFRDIFIREGEEFFRDLEHRACREWSHNDYTVLAAGGSTLLFRGNREILLKHSILLVLSGSDEVLWDRITRDGIPPFFQGENGFQLMKEKNSLSAEILNRHGDIELTVDNCSHDECADEACIRIEEFIAAAANRPNTFGSSIRVTTFGESHGKAVGAVLDGLPPGIPVDPVKLQSELSRRRPGQSSVTTARNEPDTLEILSGIFENKTTGTPLCMLVYNRDQDSSKYDDLKDIFRPGHADITFWKKYGIRDHRGGGRSSGRETIGRVAAGAVIRQVLEQQGITITGYTESIGGITGSRVEYDFIEKNPVRAADPDAAPVMEEAVLAAKKNLDSLGGTAVLVISGVPAGLGDPVFMKLDARLGQAMLSLGAVKGVEFGAGFRSAAMKGSEWNDSMKDGRFLSNNAGGILGGISTGQDIVIRAAVKPTPSIAQPQQTMDIHGNNRMIEIHGRHDPCILPRIIPVLEAMAAMVIYDAGRIQENLVRKPVS